MVGASFRISPGARAKLTAGAVPGVFLLLGAFICFEAMQVPVGTVRMPGAGFFPLLLGILLSVLAIVLFGMSLAGPTGAATRIWPEQPDVVYLVATIVVAVWLFERAGFLITMALFLGVVMRVLGTASWVTVVTVAAAASVTAYVVFSRVLLIALPSGILPF